MFIVELLTEAESELTDACQWYEDKQPGLAKRFLSEIDKYLTLISKNPFHFPLRFSERYRFASLSIFPFVIVFKIDEERQIVYVNSIFHTSRNPNKL